MNTTHIAKTPNWKKLLSRGPWRCWRIETNYTTHIWKLGSSCSWNFIGLSLICAEKKSKKYSRKMSQKRMVQKDMTTPQIVQVKKLGWPCFNLKMIANLSQCWGIQRWLWQKAREKLQILTRKCLKICWTQGVNLEITPKWDGNLRSWWETPQTSRLKMFGKFLKTTFIGQISSRCNWCLLGHRTALKSLKFYWVTYS
jgi:hypothetical protein